VTPSGRALVQRSSNSRHAAILRRRARPASADIAETLASAATTVAPFDLTLARCGVFPGPRQPRVLWCGLEDPRDGCRRWLAAAEAPLRALGFPPEERPFTAHVTLARAPSPEGSRAVAALLPKLAAPPP